MCSILILHPYLIRPAFQFLWYWLPARNPPHTPTCLLFHYLAFLKLGVKESKRGRKPTLEWMNECEPTGSSYTACLQCCFEVAIAAVPAEAGSWRDDKEIKIQGFHEYFILGEMGEGEKQFGQKRKNCQIEVLQLASAAVCLFLSSHLLVSFPPTRWTNFII